MCTLHGRRYIKPIEGVHSAECQSPGTKGGSFNLTGFNDFLKKSSQIIKGGGHVPLVPPWFLRLCTRY